MKTGYNNKVISFEVYNESVLESNTEFLTYEFVTNHKKRKRLLAAIRRLPLQCRMCTILFYYEGMSYGEIAEAFEISRQDVDNALMKSKRLIRKDLKKGADLGKVEILEQKDQVIPVLTQVLKTDVEEMELERNVEKLIRYCEVEAPEGSVKCSIIFNCYN